MPRGSQKVVYAAIAANLGIALSKFAAALLTGSAAMLAEAFHSSADTGNELLLLIGLKRSSRPPDQQHPFGHARELYFWAFLVAISIFAVGGGISIYRGIHGILSPHPLEDPLWNYVVLGAAAVFEGGSWVVARRELHRRRRPGESSIEAIRKSKDPSVFTVVVEDTAALAGLIIAFLGVFLSHRFNNVLIDPAASILIGIVLILAAGALAVETGGLLVGESADQSTSETLPSIIAADDAVRGVGKTLTMQLGPDDVLLVADVSFHPQLGTGELEEAVDRIERRIQERYPDIKRIYF
jgi:cation diffusion facilitator family transporter